MKLESRDLPDVLSGERRVIRDPRAGLISYYVDGPNPSAQPRHPSNRHPPLLLIHSINAAPSAHEVKPLYDACKRTRRCYAIDLPGFGHSERSDRPYRQRLMMDAIMATATLIRSEHPGQPLDALAISLSCEFLVRVAVEHPGLIRSLALVSPTGFARNAPSQGPPEADCGRPGLYRVLSKPYLGKRLFKLLTSPPSMRFFLRKTWGGREIDEQMFKDARRMSQHPGAHHAPLHFISGFLFSADIASVYRTVQQPVWMAHGVRGDFADYSRSDSFRDRDNWHIHSFDTGALPHFERPEAFVASYRAFLQALELGAADEAAGSQH